MNCMADSKENLNEILGVKGFSFLSAIHAHLKKSSEFAVFLYETS